MIVLIGTVGSESKSVPGAVRTSIQGSGLTMRAPDGWWAPRKKRIQASGFSVSPIGSPSRR